MLSNELQEVLQAIRSRQDEVSRLKVIVDGHLANEQSYKVMAQNVNAKLRLAETELDELQIKLRNVIVADDKKYGIKGPEVQAPAEPDPDPEPVQIGRES